MEAKGKYSTEREHTRKKCMNHIFLLHSILMQFPYNAHFEKVVFI